MELAFLHRPSPSLTTPQFPHFLISPRHLRLNLTTTRARKLSATLLLQKMKKKRKTLSIEIEGGEMEEEEDEEEEEEELEEEERASYLSLSEKPDRTVRVVEDEFGFGERGYGPTTPDHRSGYVALLGKPNVGKSTLLNQIIGQKLCIVTDKPQTTRHRILGLCSKPEYQIILYDTPGVMEKKINKLHFMMIKNVKSATVEADCVLVVVDACKVPEKIDGLLEEGIRKQKDKIPTLLVLNKKDLIKPGEIAKRIQWYEKFTDVDDVIPVSAKHGQGIEDIKEWIVSKLPLGPAYYPKVHVVSYKSRAAAKDFIQIEILMRKSRRR